METKELEALETEETEAIPAEAEDSPESEATAAEDEYAAQAEPAAEESDDDVDDDFDDFATGEKPAEEPAGVRSEEDAEPEKGEKKPKLGFGRIKKGIGGVVKSTGKRIGRLPWKNIGIGAGIAAGVCAVIYLGGALFYSSHFYYHTALGSFDCSNLTAEKAEEKIRSELENYSFIIRERGDKTESISGKSIDYVCKSISGISEAMENQNPFKWPFDKDARIQVIKIESEFDADKLYHEAEKLDCFAESIRDMDGAYAGVYYEDGTYHMREVENKNAISFERLYSALLAGFNGTYKDMSLEEEGVYVLMADEDNMRHAIEEMNKYVSTTVTYTRGSETFELNGDTINAWISIDPDCTVNISDEGIAEYVSELANLYNTIGINRGFTTSYGDTITVNGGDYGWEIDKIKEAAALKENIANGDVVSRDPECKHKEVGDSSTAITGTYVEVNIAAQTLWFYKNGELIVTTPVVTGNPLKGNSTHKGVYSLKYKEKDAVLRGDNYESPVSYWMPFNGGEGLHDAPWRGAFGGSIYRGGGSHGCVNMPYNAAAKVFANIDPGTPVIVF